MKLLVENELQENEFHTKTINGKSVRFPAKAEAVEGIKGIIDVNLQQHYGICRIYDFCPKEGRLIIELTSPLSFKLKELKNNQPLEERKWFLTTIMWQVGEGLNQLHKHHVVAKQMLRIEDLFCTMEEGLLKVKFNPYEMSQENTPKWHICTYPGAKAENWRALPKVFDKIMQELFTYGEMLSQRKAHPEISFLSEILKGTALTVQSNRKIWKTCEHSPFFWSPVMRAEYIVSFFTTYKARRKKEETNWQMNTLDARFQKKVIIPMKWTTKVDEELLNHLNVHARMDNPRFSGYGDSFFSYLVFMRNTIVHCHEFPLQLEPIIGSNCGTAETYFRALEPKTLLSIFTTVELETHFKELNDKYLSLDGE